MVRPWSYPRSSIPPASDDLAGGGHLFKQRRRPLAPAPHRVRRDLAAADDEVVGVVAAVADTVLHPLVLVDHQLPTGDGDPLKRHERRRVAEPVGILRLDGLGPRGAQPPVRDGGVEDRLLGVDVRLVDRRRLDRLQEISDRVAVHGRHSLPGFMFESHLVSGSSLGAGTHEELAGADEAVGCLEAGEGGLDLVPHRRPLLRRDAGEHLVQRPEGLPLEPDAFRRRRKPQRGGDGVDGHVGEARRGERGLAGRPARRG